jgi:ribonuclease HI
VDSSATIKSNGVEVVLTTSRGEELAYAIRIGFKTTNNEAKYEAVLAGLEIARELGAEDVEVRSGSQVIVCQIQGEYEVKGEHMKYLRYESSDPN